jgi:hypothetical protein
MPYTDESYGINVMVLEGCPWYRVKDLGDAVTFCVGINFAIVTQREEARLRMNDIITAAPFAIDTRFPAGVAYVCAAKGDWERKFTQVMEALCFKETTTNPGSAGGGGGGKANMLRSMTQPHDGPVTPMEWDYNMAERSFFTGLESMRAQMGRAERCYARRNFEAEFGLVWQ